MVLATSPTIATPTISGAVTWPLNIRQTFAPGTTVAGFNVGSRAGPPAATANGDMWYDTLAPGMAYRANNRALIVGGRMAQVIVRPPNVTTQFTDCILKCTSNAWASYLVFLHTADSGMEAFTNQTWINHQFLQVDVTVASNDHDPRIVWKHTGTFSISSYIPSTARISSIRFTIQDASILALRDSGQLVWEVLWLTASGNYTTAVGAPVWEMVECRWVDGFPATSQELPYFSSP